MKNKTWYLAGAFLLVLAAILIFSFVPIASAEKINEAATIYKSDSCGCCGIYTVYMRDRAEEVNVVVKNDLDSVKIQRGVPSQLESCHTMMIGGYFVEGHVPVEAIKKLLDEKPDIAGIALPGMPSGSPGMSGSKAETWIIYAVHKDGSYEEFMRI